MVCGLSVGMWMSAYFVLEALGTRYDYLGFLCGVAAFFVLMGALRAARHFRDTENGGEFTFALAYRYLYWLALFASLIAALARFIYVSWVDASYLPMLLDMTVKAVEQAGMAADESFRVTLDMLLRPAHFAMLFLLMDIMGAALLNLLLALFLMRRSPRSNG